MRRAEVASQSAVQKQQLRSASAQPLGLFKALPLPSVTFKCILLLPAAVSAPAQTVIGFSHLESEL